MSEHTDDGDIEEQDEREIPAMEGGAEELFGGFSVLSPGVEIVLEGRPFTAPADD